MRTSSVALIGVMLAACSPAPPTLQAPQPEPAKVDTAVAGVVSAVSNGPADFEAPSGNVGCNYIPAGGNGVYHSPDGGAELICDRIEPVYVRFSLSERGLATLDEHVRDTGCCGGPVLTYGTHWQGGPFQCDMRETGLVCSNADGHGFTLSRSAATGR
ncbi:MAG: hypothetical protein QM759_10810 [Terricaulis sp.]